MLEVDYSQSVFKVVVIIPLFVCDWCAKNITKVQIAVKVERTQTNFAFKLENVNKGISI